MTHPFIPGDPRAPNHEYFRKRWDVKMPRWSKNMRFFDQDAPFDPEMPGQALPGSPVNTVQPVVTPASGLFGTVFTTDNGTWDPIADSYTYQWYAGNVIITGEVTNTYTSVSGDIDKDLTCRIRGVNGTGTSTPVTSTIGAVTVAAPINTTAPLLSGSGFVGTGHSVDNGSWTNFPTMFTYQWWLGAAEIMGATANNYVPIPSDSGQALSCIVTAGNSGGNTSELSSNSITVTYTIPVNSVPPTVSGATPVGSTLTADAGTWTSPATFAYQWTSNGADVAGATGATFDTTIAEAETAVGCDVVGTNSGGSSAPVSSSNTITVDADVGEEPNPDIVNVHMLYDFVDIVGDAVEEMHGFALENTGGTVDSVNLLFGKNTTALLGSNSAQVTLSAPHEFDFAFVTGDFVLENWIYYSGSGNERMIMALWSFNSGQRNWRFSIMSDGNGNLLNFGFNTDGTSSASQINVPGPPVPKDQWVHCVAQRSGDRYICFVDGVPGTPLVTTERPDGSNIPEMTWARLGSGGTSFNGNYGDHRITLGEAFYPEIGFLPPTASFPRPQAIPVNTTPPLITGDGKIGSVHTVSDGSWDNSPTSFVRRWLRDGTPISGAIGTSYTPVAADDNTTLTADVAATNSGGTSAPALSSNSITVTYTIPVNSVPPTVSGATPVGSTLTVDERTWTSPAAFTYQWTSNGADIAGATAATFDTTSAEAETAVGCDVVGFNSGGSSAPVSSSNTITIDEELGAPNPDIANVHHLYDFVDIIGNAVGDRHGFALSNSGAGVDSTNLLFGANTTRFTGSNGVDLIADATHRDDFRFVSGDFVLEAWIYISGAGDWRTFASVYNFLLNNRIWRFQVLPDASNTVVVFGFYTDAAVGGSQVVVQGPTVPKDQWVHCVAQRGGDSYICFVNGVPGTPLVTTARPDEVGTYQLRFGRENSAGNELFGSMGDTRITLGEAFYPETGFTPPVAPFPRTVEDPPKTLTAPVLIGLGIINEVISSGDGSWSGNPTGFTYQWVIDGDDVIGETTNTYTPEITDLDKGLRCRVTATNIFGSTMVDSNIVTIGVRKLTPVTTGLVYELHADLGLNLTGIAVGDWTDQEGSIVVATDLGAPTRVVSGTPSRADVVRFLKGDTMTRAGALPTFPAGAGDRTFFMVAGWPVVPDEFSGFMYGVSSDNLASGISADPNDDLLQVSGWGPANDFSYTVSPFSVNWAVVSFILDANAGEGFIDGVSDFTFNHVFNTDVGVSAELLINDAGGGDVFDLASVLIYDVALSAGDHAAVVDFLTAKYVTPAVDILSPSVIIAVEDQPNSQFAPLVIRVTVSDNISIDGTSVAYGDVNATMSDGSVVDVVGVSGIPMASSGSEFMLLNILPVNGWVGVNCLLNVDGGAVLDMAGNTNTSANLDYVTTLPVGTAPTALITLGSDPTTEFGPLVVSVEYVSTNDIIDFTTIDGSELVVTGAIVTRIQTSSVPIANAQSIIMAYTVVPVDGWDGQNLNFDVADDTVRDSLGVGILAASGSYSLSLVTAGPIIQMSTADPILITDPMTLTVTLTDSSLVDGATVAYTDLEVTGSLGEGVSVVGISGVPASTGSPIVLVLEITPDDGWIGQLFELKYADDAVLNTDTIGNSLTIQNYTNNLSGELQTTVNFTPLELSIIAGWHRLEENRTIDGVTKALVDYHVTGTGGFGHSMAVRNCIISNFKSAVESLRGEFMLIAGGDYTNIQAVISGGTYWGAGIKRVKSYGKMWVRNIKMDLNYQQPQPSNTDCFNVDGPYINPPATWTNFMKDCELVGGSDSVLDMKEPLDCLRTVFDGRQAGQTVGAAYLIKFWQPGRRRFAYCDFYCSTRFESMIWLIDKGNDIQFYNCKFHYPDSPQYPGGATLDYVDSAFVRFRTGTSMANITIVTQPFDFLTDPWFTGA